MNEIIILGGSGHGREVADVVSAAARADRYWRVPVSILDDDHQLQGRMVAGLPVRGGTRDGVPGAAALLGVGYPELKYRLLNGLDVSGYDWPVLVHPDASVGSRVTLGRGSFVQAGCILTCDVSLGEFVTLNIGVTLSHDVEIARLATCSPGAHVGGNVTIGEGAFIGIGASIHQRVTIGPWSVVGAGAVVVEDVPANSVVVGVPARVIRERENGWYRDS